MSTVPKKVTVIVYSAKGLKPKNKGKHKFSVIFGIGTNKFRTEVVEDLFDNPVFNTESEIDVGDPSLPLILTVTEKQEKDALGQITIALGDLSHNRTNRPLTVPLRAHKKCPNPEGELTIEAWISASTLGVPPTISITGTEGETKNSVSAGFKKLKDRISHSPLPIRKSGDGKEHKRSHSESLFNTAPKGSVSCHDLTNFTSYHPDNKQLQVFPAESLSSLDSISETSGSKKPEVSGISPNEGPVEGGTKITIRGTNLGLNKDDVVGLFVCGANVLGSMVYVSSSKLTCVTKAWKACEGNVTVETQSGGKGSSLVKFTFVSREPASDSASEVSSLSRSSSRGDADLKRTESNRSDKSEKTLNVPSSEPSGLMKNLKAKSMFDLTLVPIMGKNLKPEVTGMSPVEAPADEVTRLMIQGSNLGQSKSDVVRLSVCGIDCLSTIEHESPSRIFCYVGPAKVGTGNVTIETYSGGKASSLCKFSFIEGREDETSSWAAVPYSASEGQNSKLTVSEHVSRSKGDDRQDQSELINTGGKTLQPNGKLVVEIQPMRMDKKSTSPFRAFKGKKSDKDKAPEIPDKLDRTYEISTSEHMNNDTLNKKINELEQELTVSDERIRKLQIENKSLKDENERMRRYMENLVNRAITSCPQILCVDDKI